MKRITLQLCLLCAVFPSLIAVAGAQVHLRNTRPASGRERPEIPPQIIDFDGFQPGAIVSVVHGSEGGGPIGVTAFNPDLGSSAAAITFDSANPTGGDRDLGTPHQDFGGPGIGGGGGIGSPFANSRPLHKILIVPENLTDANNDGLVDVPSDEEQQPVSMFFDFTAFGPTTVKGLTVMDVVYGGLSAEGGATPNIEFFNAAGDLIRRINIPVLDNNGVLQMEFGKGVKHVALMAVNLLGPGAIDEVVFHKDCLGSIGDRVWFDMDRDGLQDPSEPGLEGVVVRLVQNSVIIASMATSRTGFYRFDELCKGTYTVVVDETTLPRGFVTTPCNAGLEDRDNDCSPLTYAVQHDGATTVNVDFGFNSPCSGMIGDFVWHDVNRNGLQDQDEPGLEAVRVRLRDANGDLVSQVTTGPNGFYTFLGLCQGSYTVEVVPGTLPPDFFPTLCNVGGNDAVDSECSPFDLSLPSDSTIDENTDFGFQSLATGSIGDFIWGDFDCDGFQDTPEGDINNEGGLDGVCLLLRDDMGVVIQQTTSGGGGRYRFTGLPDGNYVVEVELTTLPPGLIESPCDPGLSDDTDNDCSGVAVTLQGGGPLSLGGINVVINIDFGFQTSPCGGQACSPAFWRSVPANQWPAPYTPDTLFSSVFEDAFPGMTLGDVLAPGTSDDLRRLGRHVIGALLNAAETNFAYALTTGEVIGLFNEVFPATTVEYISLTDYFRDLNEQFCPL